VRALVALFTAITVGTVWEPCATLGPSESAIGDNDQFIAPAYVMDRTVGERIAVLDVTPSDHLSRSRNSALDIAAVNKLAGLIIGVRGWRRERLKWCVFTTEVARVRASNQSVSIKCSYMKPSDQVVWRDRAGISPDRSYKTSGTRLEIEGVFKIPTHFKRQAHSWAQLCLGDGDLLVRDVSLRFHNLRLPKIDESLRPGDNEQCNSEDNFNPIRQPEIKERVRGLPISIGWLLVSLFGGIWIGSQAYRRDSTCLGIVAAILITLSIPGAFISFFWLNNL
jgi:hypothetical protein